MRAGNLRCALLPVFFLAALPGIALSAAPDKSPSKPCVQVWSRPSPQAIWRAVREEHSIIPIAPGKSVADLLLRIDTAHTACLVDAGLIPSSAEVGEDWTKTEASFLPERTPPCWRALFIGLFMQIQALDRLASLQCPEAADALRQTRKGRMVAVPEGQGIFEDSRDDYIVFVLDVMKQIIPLQKALGATGEPETAFPSQLKRLSQVEQYLVTGLQIIADNAEQVRQSYGSAGAVISRSGRDKAVGLIWRLDDALRRPAGAPPSPQSSKAFRDFAPLPDGTETREGTLICWLRQLEAQSRLTAGDTPAVAAEKQRISSSLVKLQKDLAGACAKGPPADPGNRPGFEKEWMHQLEQVAARAAPLAKKD